MKNMRLYFNALNLLTFQHFKLWDPEMAGQGFSISYPKGVMWVKYEFLKTTKSLEQ